jgi:DNA topoisomerase I
MPDRRLLAVRAARSAGLRYVNEGEPGIARLRSGKHFRYVSPSGRTLRDKRALRRIRQLAIPPAYEDVWICPDARGHIQAVGRDAKGRKQYRYHPAWRATRDATKFHRMIVFAKILPKLRKDVAHDLESRPLTKRKVVAAVIQLLDGTALRVGNDEYVKANGSYGVTTLRNHHARVQGDAIQLRFRGKGGKAIEVDYRDRRIARVVAECQELAGHRLFDFQTDDGSVESVSSTDVNQYLRERTGGDFSAKDFRTWHASLEFALAASALGKADGARGDEKAALASALTSTAQKLHNTPAICRKCYVHPAVIAGLTAGRLPRFADGKPRRSSTWTKAEESLRRFLVEQAKLEARSGIKIGKSAS